MSIPKAIEPTENQHYSALCAMYLEAPINRIYAPNINIWNSGSEISITLKEDFFHSGGAVHGSVYFKMLDDAAYFAANSIEFRYFVLTADFRIDLLRPCSHGRITAKGSIIRAGRQDILAESKLFTEDNKLLATGIGRFSRGKLPLSSVESYLKSVQ